MKYFSQNSKEEDFRKMCQKLYYDLQARGYTSKVLNPLFTEALARVQKKTIAEQKNTEQLFLKIPFDPFGPTRKEIFDALDLDNDEFDQILQYAEAGRITLCYTRPRNLRDLVAPTKKCSNPLQKSLS